MSKAYKVTLVYQSAVVSTFVDTTVDDENVIADLAVNNLVYEFGDRMEGPQDYEVEEIQEENQNG